MKSLLLALSILLFTGCTERLILVPQSQYYPTFPIEEFDKAEKCKQQMWEESDDNATYLVSYKKEALKCIKENKDNRQKLNLLIDKVKNFNVKINELNKIQSEKQPQEVK